jgi:hypothetical protein
MNLVYHEIKPSNDIQGTSGFSEYNSIDFNIVASGRQMMLGSIKIAGQLIVNSTGSGIAGTRTDKTKDIKLDNKIGAHAVFSSFQSEITTGNNAQVLENCQEYPRYCALLNVASEKETDVCDLVDQCQLKGAFESNGSINLAQQFTNTANASAVADEDPSFCIHPKICFNSAIGSKLYSFDKLGNIKISCNLARTVNALYGQDMNANVNYSLHNVRLLFMSVPDSGQQAPLLMDSYAMIKSTMVSPQINVQSRVPARRVKSCSIVFLRQKQESSLKQNTNELQQLPQLDEVSYSFQDTLTNYITYNIRDLGDALKRGIQSVPSADTNPRNNSVQPDNQAGQRGYVLGTDFDGEFIDLSQQKFGFLCKSKFEQMNNDQRLVYLYFHSSISL